MDSRERKSLEYHEEIKSYIGEKLYKKLISIGKGILFYKNIKLEPCVSYYVLGDETKLNQFMAYYLVRMANTKGSKRPSFERVMVEDFISRRKSNEWNSPTDILFIYISNLESYSPKEEGWKFGSAVPSEVIMRNRLGYATIILSEREIKPLNKVKELSKITLFENMKIKKKEEKNQIEGTPDANITESTASDTQSNNGSNNVSAVFQGR